MVYKIGGKMEAFNIKIIKNKLYLDLDEIVQFLDTKKEETEVIEYFQILRQLASNTKDEKDILKGNL
jgi:hypothetical protein